MTKKEKMKKVLALLIVIYIALTIDATAMFFQGQLTDEGVFLLALNYAIALSTLIYIASDIIRIILNKRNALRAYYALYELLMQMRICYKMMEFAQIEDPKKNELKQYIENIETRLIKSGEFLINNKILRNSEKEQIKKIIQEIKIEKF